MNASTAGGFRNITPSQLATLVPRSAKAASSLVALGFANLMNLAGGMLAYVDAGLPVERR